MSAYLQFLNHFKGDFCTSSIIHMTPVALLDFNFLLTETTLQAFQVSYNCHCKPLLPNAIFIFSALHTSFLHVVALVIFLQQHLDIKSPVRYCWYSKSEEMAVPKTSLWKVCIKCMFLCTVFFSTFFFSLFLNVTLVLFNDLGSCT